jgi:co-chaperonin GroES (HSP10)
MTDQKKIDEEIKAHFGPIRDLLLVEREMAQDKAGLIVLPERYQFKGMLAEVVKQGPQVALPKVDRCVTVLCSPNGLMNSFGNSSQMALIRAHHLMAALEGPKDEEDFFPLNSWYLYEPDPIVEIEGGIFLPDQAKVNPSTGTLLRVPAKEKKLKGGERAIFQWSRTRHIVQKGVDLALGDRPIALYHGKDAQPLDTRLIVETELPELMLGEIERPLSYAREPSVAVIHSIGDGVTDLELGPGDRVEIERVKPMDHPAGVCFDPHNVRMRIVDEKSILGRYE